MGKGQESKGGDLMARSYAGLANMASRFGFRLAKAREGSQHLGMPVRYLLEAQERRVALPQLGRGAEA